MPAAAPYIELHAHSAFSFLDGASTPAELATAAAGLGYPALALTDHDGIWGSREFAEACKGRAAAGDHRRRADGGALRRWGGVCASHPAGRGRERLSQPLPAADRRPLPHARRSRPRRRAAVGDPRAAGGARRGARLPLRLRSRRGAGGGLGAGRHGAGRAARPAPARCLRARALPGRAAAPLLAPRPRPQPLAHPARLPPRRSLRRDRQRPLPQPPPRPAPGRLRRRRAGSDAGGVRAAPPRQPQLGAGLAAGDGRPLRRAPRGGGRDRAPGRAPSLRPDQGARLPLPRGGRRRLRARRALPTSADRPLRRPQESRETRKVASTRSWRRSATSASPASSSSTTSCWSWPATSRSRFAALPRLGRSCRRAAAGAPASARSSAT